MVRPDDLTPLLTPSNGPGLRFGQGQVLAWNPETGANSISYHGATLTNVPILNTGEAIALKAGHIVGLLSWLGSYWILGRITVPGGPDFASASLAFASATDSATNFSITNVELPKVSTSLAVPAWADEALVFVNGAITAFNGSGENPAFLGGRCTIAGQVGNLNFTEAAGPHWVSIFAAKTLIVQNPGATIAVATEGSTGAGGLTWPTNATHRANVDAFAIFRSVT